MQVTDSSWRRGTAAYRALVVTQTIAWGAISFGKVVTGQRRMLFTADRAGLLAAIVAICCLAAGVLTYALRFHRATSPSARRATLIATWTWLQASGLVALVAYFKSGDGRCFLAGVVALVAMHAFSPNRFID